MSRQNPIIFFAVLALIIGMHSDAKSYSSGFAGATKKNSAIGCGTCHQGQTFSFPVTVSGPISVTAGQTVQFTLQMPTLGRPRAGVNIASRRGTLTPVTPGTGMSAFPTGEIVHNIPLPISGSTATILFNYTAPSSPGMDTIFSAGMVSAGFLSSDDWNWSPDLFVNVIPTQKTLDLTCLIEGLYNQGSDSMTGDTAIVYLRSSVSPYTILESAKQFLGSTGSGIFRFNSAQNGVPYYVVAVQRNSIETWSALPQSFSSDSMSYNFTTSSSQAFGSNLKQVDTSPVLFAIYSGDVNRDGAVDATDLSMIDNDASNFLSGYVVTDLNGDNFVDGTDFAIADNNAANYVSVVRP